MPWKNTQVMDLKIQMIADYYKNMYGPTDLSRIYGLSRKTVYKWINRYKQDPDNGLQDRSRAPHYNPNAVPEQVRKIIIQTKIQYPHLGPKKVMDYLRRQHAHQNLPADSTAGEILKKAGFVRPRRRKARVAPNGFPFNHCDTPNSIWSTDYKGDFKLGNRKRCYPLTISDNFSRYLLACQALTGTRYLSASDNGAPFASTSFGGISRLSAWWVRLGICPERIEKGKPNQNGRHERMHRSLKDGAIKPPRFSLTAQQKAFDQYRYEYNHIRSHESLERKVPADVYRPSSRSLPAKLADIEYGQSFNVRMVHHGGEVKWQGRIFYLSQVLAKEPVGFKQISQDRWAIYYSFYLLGYWNERKRKLESKKSNNPDKSPHSRPA
jgi:transposase InsO family protein